MDVRSIPGMYITRETHESITDCNLANLIYEDASTLVSKAGTQTEYWYILQDTPMNATTCLALGFTKVTDAALASQLINSNAVGYTKAGSGIGWKANAPSKFLSRTNSQLLQALD